MIVQLPGIQPEIAVQAIPEDERVWVPQAPGVWFRPLLLNTVTGSWCNLLRVRKSGVLSRHIHPSWVTGYVIRGAWRYLEHDWIAAEGSFVYEPPGEIHTLVVDELVGAAEMITFFNIHGAMIYVDDAGKATGYEDVFTKIEMCRRHPPSGRLQQGPRRRLSAGTDTARCWLWRPLVPLAAGRNRLSCWSPPPGGGLGGAKRSAEG